jgi:hypothetical protein
MQADRPWRSQTSGQCLDDDGRLFPSGFNFDEIETVMPISKSFANNMETISELRMKGAVDRQIPRQHRLYRLSALRKKETVHQTFTKSRLMTEQGYPDLRDEELCATIMDRKRPTSELFIPNDGSARLLKILSGKFSNCSILTTEAGFVGIGVNQIEKGDVVTFMFGATAPLVLLPYPGHYRMVGCAYVSGMMDPDLLDNYYEKGLLPPTRFCIR